MTLTQSQMQKSVKKFQEKRSEFIDKMIRRHGKERVREEFSEERKDQILNDIVEFNLKLQ